ncbi:MAG: PH domain-containing protein [Parcubacteria group bacterium]|jgi:uncharacterized membrane protein YdbT with pleckstrin-like domain
MLNFVSKNITNYESDENTIVVIHRHWFDIIQNFFLLIIMVFFLIGSYAILPALFPVLEITLYKNLLAFAESSFAMLILILFFLVWIDYYFDVWVITNKRIINIEQKGLFSREVSELELDKIQDVSVSVLGIIPTFLNYGDVFIQTAGEKERFVFKKIANPYWIKDLIMSLEKTNEKKMEKERAMGEAQELKSALRDNQLQ